MPIMKEIILSRKRLLNVYNLSELMVSRSGLVDVECRLKKYFMDYNLCRVGIFGIKSDFYYFTMKANKGELLHFCFSEEEDIIETLENTQDERFNLRKGMHYPVFKREFTSSSFYVYDFLNENLLEVVKSMSLGKGYCAKLRSSNVSWQEFNLAI